MIKFIRHSGSTTQYNTTWSNVKKQKRTKRERKRKKRVKHAYTSTKQTCDSVMKISKKTFSLISHTLHCPVITSCLYQRRCCCLVSLCSRLVVFCLHYLDCPLRYVVLLFSRQVSIAWCMFAWIRHDAERERCVYAVHRSVIVGNENTATKTMFFLLSGAALNCFRRPTM